MPRTKRIQTLMITTRSLICLCIAALVSISVGTVSGQTGDTDKETRQDKIKEGRRLLKSAIAKTEAGEYTSALSELDSILAVDDANPDAYYYKGIAQANTGDTTGAIATLTLGSEKVPLARRLKIYLAHLLLAGGQNDQALELINSVLAIKPGEGEALYLKGVLLQKAGDNAGAIEAYEKALEVTVAKGDKR
jgi:Flp pilus assembly protein TadD